MAIGCSHGKHICPKARESVLKFKASFKPSLSVHLGDFCDTAAFRTGARGIDADSAEPVTPDIDGGMQFLREYRPSIVLCGNHEARLWTLRNSPNAVIAYAAHRAVEAIEEGTRKLGARLIPYDGIYQEYRFGDILATHGTFYNEMAARDMAEAYSSKVIFAHTHRAMQSPGRTMKATRGYCVGTLTRKREMSYASCRRATMAWGMGIVAGEYREGAKPESAIWLFEGPSENNDVEWRLPV